MRPTKHTTPMRSLRLIIEGGHPTLRHDVREGLAKKLQEALVELVDLSLLGVQARWNVTGPQFASLERQLDNLVSAWRALADSVAERAVALGISPDVRTSTVAHQSRVDPLVAGPLHDREVVAAFSSRLSDAIARMRTRMDRVHEHDRVTEDVLIRVVAALERQRWSLHAQATDHQALVR